MGCKIEGCGKVEWARGFCVHHHYLWRRGRLTAEPNPPRPTRVKKRVHTQAWIKKHGFTSGLWRLGREGE